MKILTLGDSHCRLLELNGELREINSNYKGIQSEVVALPGATISGFGKRESTLNASKTFINKVKESEPDYLCFALGQVDLELGYYFRRVVKNESLEFSDFLSFLLKSYLESTIKLSKELGYGPEQVIFKGVNLSVLTNSRTKAINYTSRIIAENISDMEESKKMRQKLSEVFPSNLERNYNHIAFNKELYLCAVKAGMKYFDINSYVEDSNNKGKVNLKYIPSAFDHHLLDSLYMREIHINEIIYTALRR